MKRNISLPGQIDREEEEERRGGGKEGGKRSECNELLQNITH